MTQKYYLAHPLDSRKRIRKWELEMESKYDVELINPFYDVEREEIKNIDVGRKGRYEGLDDIELVQRDVGFIANSDGIIAIIDGNISYGTIQEMVYAKILHKPVFSVITNGHHNHPWLKYHSKVICKNLKYIEEIIKHRTYDRERIKSKNLEEFIGNLPKDFP